MLCPACKTETPDDASCCSQCGLTLQSSGDTATPSPEPTEAAKPRPAAAFFSPCPHCGHKVAAGAKTCPKCGKSPDEAPVTEEAKPDEPETRRGGKKGIFIAIAGVLAVAGGLALFKGKPAETPATTPAKTQASATTTAPAGPVAYENEKLSAPAPRASATKETSKESGKDRKPAENKAEKTAKADKPASAPAKAAPAKKEAAKEPRETDRVPPREPQQPPVAQPKAAPGWHEALKAQLRECEKKSYFPRTWCQDQAKRQYCEGHWNAVPECDRPDNSPQYKG